MGELVGLMAELIWTLPARSQEFQQGPHILLANGRVTLRWDAESETGAYVWASANFVGVENVEFTAYDSCTPEQTMAYDRLVKIEPSDKLAGLRGNGSKFLQHFRIFFDDIGCLEVLAEGFEPPQD
jgi:hypothetical protein